MPQTITEKIFSSRVGYDVAPGDVVIAPIDFCFSHDGNRPQPLEVFLELGGIRVLDPSRVAFFLDHAPNSHTPAVADMHRRIKTFAQQQDITVYPAGRGISHQVLAEAGHAIPGRIIIGSDSHTCTAGAFNLLATGVGSTDLATAMMLGKLWFKVPETIRTIIDGGLPLGVYAKDLVLHIIGLLGADGATYRAVEFLGSTIATLSIEARMTIANMAIEMGAKFGLMEADKATTDYVQAHTDSQFSTYTSDRDSEVLRELHVDARLLEPLVAMPPNPDHVVPAAELSNVPIHQATLGTSANGQLEDLQHAAAVLRGRQLHPSVKLFVTAATKLVYLQALKEGLVDVFNDAGALWGTPGCSGCTGGSGFGVPGDGENMITSANRNFVGRTGNSRASIYLASPATVIASAIEGRIADPRPFLSEAAAGAGA